MTAGLTKTFPLMLIALSGCQLPPQFATGSTLDLQSADSDDASTPPDLTPAWQPPDLSLADLSPPLLSGNQLQLGNDPNLAALKITVTDHDTGLPIPARVIFRPPPAAGFADSISSGMFAVNSPGSSIGAVVAPGVVGSPE